MYKSFCIYTEAFVVCKRCRREKRKAGSLVNCRHDIAADKDSYSCGSRMNGFREMIRGTGKRYVGGDSLFHTVLLLYEILIY